MLSLLFGIGSCHFSAISLGAILDQTCEYGILPSRTSKYVTMRNPLVHIRKLRVIVGAIEVATCKCNNAHGPLPSSHGQYQAQAVGNDAFSYSQLPYMFLARQYF